MGPLIYLQRMLGIDPNNKTREQYMKKGLRSGKLGLNAENEQYDDTPFPGKK